MKRLLFPLLAALALPTAVYSTTEIEPEPKSPILKIHMRELEKSLNLTAKNLERIVVSLGLLL